MADSGNSLTKGENLKRANVNTVCHWCGISNCLSGSEDHLIYDDGKGDKEDSNSEYDNPDEYAVESDNYESNKCESDEGKSNEREFDEGESNEDEKRPIESKHFKHEEVNLVIKIEKINSSTECFVPNEPNKVLKEKEKGVLHDENIKQLMKEISTAITKVYIEEIFEILKEINNKKLE
ncbi:33669_t:CDS:2, partial [Gigaspora margarita]